MPEQHPCQMDCDVGAIRADYDPKNCCGVPTEHYFVYKRRKYFLCLTHMGTTGILALGGYCLDATGNRVEPRW